MAKRPKFPTKAPTYTTENLMKNGRVFRVAIFEDGEYICQLMPTEVKKWLYKAEASALKYVENEAYYTVIRIQNAIEYLAARAKRPHNIEAKAQMELF